VDSTERVNLRCSAIIFRPELVLLLRRARERDSDWVLPGGTPRAGESVASCARREVAEETGLHVTVDRVALVLEASNSAEGVHLVDLVFIARETDMRAQPQELEPGLTPVFYPVAEVAQLALRPPISGHLRSLYREPRRGAAYLGNVWRPSDLVSDSVPGSVGGT